ncbi:hypothetical protein BGW38_004022 [Lunasporangiospora selenospora]|uniref:AAA+ ATPase domain-containing protein n=1 Tax=Lunasporangiospora selenospora TaxID=979761 RepID=A0A9P6KGU8_9FUNG|nr:hypothetical protein BGW38_004022 [Lunasporangiospora selenospora]
MRRVRAQERASSPKETFDTYVPGIPIGFGKRGFHLVESNKHDLDTLPYHVHPGIKRELLNTMASCLLARSSPDMCISRLPARHNNVFLSCPADGSAQMLEVLTLATAKKLGADVITVDVHDLMGLTSDIFEHHDNPWPVDHKLRGINPYLSSPIPLTGVPVELNNSSDDDSSDDDDDDDDDISNSNPRSATVFLDARMFQSRTRRGSNGSSNSPEALKEKFVKFWTTLLTSLVPGRTAEDVKRSKVVYFKDVADVLNTSVGDVLFTSLTASILTLRRAGHNVMAVAGHSPSLLSARDEEAEMTLGDDAGREHSVQSGPASLFTIVQKLHTPTTAGPRQSLNSQDNQSLASLDYELYPGPLPLFHHLSIPPFLPLPEDVRSETTLTAEQMLQQKYASENDLLLKRDKSDRIRDINLRNLSTVVEYRGSMMSSLLSSLKLAELQGIDSEIWGFNKLYKLASIAIGAASLEDPTTLEKTVVVGRSNISLDHFKQALQTMNENATLRKTLASYSSGGKKKEQGPLIRPEECDRYEKRLLGSIVDPDKIKTTFSNTITPAETIHALQTMITLPLVRPKLFSYGLLKDEFLSGLLLFGPPGTGKTLLAKAVAKESGSRMLEIKASDLFDMYVGEGEKNVSAVFSLARKLSPCVIFLDEVDSIFRARGAGGAGGPGGSHASQREILNQFMVEWDGLRSSGLNQGIVVMASTNRPFDLDDAVLRRLPRRILVDLPTEQARERILRIYLGREQLADDVDLKELVKKTQFFSGSDLKNLCVSSALAAVREDIEHQIRKMPTMSEGATGEGAEAVLDLSPLLDRYKAKSKSEAKAEVEMDEETKRVLGKRHFDKAFTQITPSCSENMESLTELRKWDGLYGDSAKARRKTIKGLGFEMDTTTPAPQSKTS